MKEDDVILQPDTTKDEDPEDADQQPEKAVAEEKEPLADDAPEEAASPRVFDFSSDFNISAVSDEPTPAPATGINRANSLGTQVPPRTPAAIPAAIPVAQEIKNLVPQQQIPTPAPKPPAPAPAKPETPAPYREPIDAEQKWPFAFGNPATSQPMMNPSASAMMPSAIPKAPAPSPAPVAPNASPAPLSEKRGPSSQPVKTIRSEGGEQAANKDAPRPTSGLQRDVFAILPNLKKGEGTVPVRNPNLVAAPGSDIKPLRTYESDVAEALAHRNISTASMAIAENKRKTGEERLGTKESAKPKEQTAELPKKAAPIPQPPKPDPEPYVPPIVKPQTREEAFAPRPAPRPVDQGFRGGSVAPEAEIPAAPSHIGRKASLVLLSLIIIGGGLAGGYYLYMRSPVSSIPLKPAAPATPQTAMVKSLVPAESQALIAVDGLSLEAITERISAEVAKPQKPGTIKEIVLTQNVNGEQKQIFPANAARAMKIPVPDIILRTLQPKWMLGVYTDVSGTKNVFVAATTDTFQNAFSGMLGWEKVIPNDLKAYISAGTTTPQGSFIDEIVRNKDVRAFVTPRDEHTVFMYSFVNNSMLVASNNEIALAEIVSRLENQAFVR